MASLEDLSDDAIKELALLARDLSENPETRKTFLRLTKKAKPNLPIPELEVEDEVARVLGESEKRVSSLEGQLRERDAKDELAKRRLKVADRVGADNVPEVEKLMLDKGIQNHDTAADYFEWMKQSNAPTPSPFNPNVIDKDTRGTLGKYFKNPTGTAREEAFAALQDIRKHSARRA